MKSLFLISAVFGLALVQSGPASASNGCFSADEMNTVENILGEVPSLPTKWFFQGPAYVASAVEPIINQLDAIILPKEGVISLGYQGIQDAQSSCSITGQGEVCDKARLEAAFEKVRDSVVSNICHG